MKFRLIFILIGFSLTSFGQTPTLGEVVTVSDAISQGFSRPTCGINHEGKVVVLWGRRNNKDAFVAIQKNSSFGNPVKLNPGSMTVFAQDWAGPEMAVSGKNVHVVLKSQPEKEGYVYVVSSSDGGTTFGDTVRVSNKNWSRFPSVAVSPNGGKVFVAYMAFEENFLEPHYVVCTSLDGGKSFGPEVKASNVKGEACDCCPASIEASKDEVILSFRNNDDDIRDVWASISKDDGKTFSSAVDIDTTDWFIGGCPSSGPDGIIKGGNFTAVWMSGISGKGRIYGSVGNASNIGNPSTLLLNPTVKQEVSQNFPSIAGTSNMVGVAWQENDFGTGSLKFGFSPEGLSSLNENDLTRVDADDGGIPENAGLAFDGSNFHMVWQNNSKHGIFYRQINVDGTSSIPDLNKPLRLFPNPASSAFHISETEGILTLTNAIGQVIKRIDLSEQQEINISHLRTGFIFVELQQGDRISRTKLLINK